MLGKRLNCCRIWSRRPNLCPGMKIPAKISEYANKKSIWPKTAENSSLLWKRPVETDLVQ